MLQCEKVGMNDELCGPQKPNTRPNYTKGSRTLPGNALEQGNHSCIETIGTCRRTCISTMKTLKQKFVKALASSALCLHYDHQSLRTLYLS